MLFKTFLYKILELQEKFLRFKLSKTIGVKSSSKRKQQYSNDCTLDLNTLAEAEKQELEDKLTNILKTYKYNPLRILDYVKAQGTQVVFLKEHLKLSVEEISAITGYAVSTVKKYARKFLNLLKTAKKSLEIMMF